MGKSLSVLVGSVTRVATDFAAPIRQELLAVEAAHTTFVKTMLEGSMSHSKVSSGWDIDHGEPC